MQIHYTLRFCEVCKKETRHAPGKRMGGRCIESHDFRTEREKLLARIADAENDVRNEEVNLQQAKDRLARLRNELV